MKRKVLNERIAQATGKPLCEISRLGFQSEMLEMEHVDDSDHREHSSVDWDDLELHRNVAFSAACDGESGEGDPADGAPSGSRPRE